MSLIYEKIVNNSIGYDKCLILENKEAFLYPIPNEIFNDWKEIRVGFCMTLTSGLNSTNEQIADTTTTNVFPTNQDLFYFGLKNNNNNLPHTSNSNFIGFGCNTGLSSVSVQFQGSLTSRFAQNSTWMIPFLMTSGNSTCLITGLSPKSDYYNNNGYGFFNSSNNMFGSGTPFTRVGLKITKNENSSFNFRGLLETDRHQITPIPTSDSSITGLVS